MHREKILYVVRPAEGGMKEHLMILVDYFRHRYHIIVACPQNDPMMREILRMGARVIPLPLEGKFYPRADRICVKILEELLRHEKIKLVHLHGYKAGLVGRPAARKWRVPSILTVHNYLGQDRVSRIPRNFFYNAERILSRWTWHYITVSQALADNLINQFKISRDKIITIYNGLHLDSFNKLRTNKILKRIRGPVVGTIARLAPQKGIDCFLRAAVNIKNIYPGAQFLIVGDGPLMKELQELAAGIGLSKCVSFLGRRRDIYPLLQIMDVFVLPSRTEGLSFTLLEALAVGCPVVASEVGGIPEIIKDGVTGFLVPPDNPQALSTAVVVMIENEERARQMSVAGRNMVWEKFSAKTMLNKTENLYEKAPVINYEPEKGAKV